MNLNKLSLTMFSVGGALGVLAAVATPAQAQQARVTGASLIDDGGAVSAVAGEVELAPGRQLQPLEDGGGTPTARFVEVDPLIEQVSTGSDFTIATLSLNYNATTAGSGGTPLENSIGNSVLGISGTREDIISIVDAFGSGVGNSEPVQASISSAVAFDNGDFLSAVAAQTELAPGQQVTIQNVNTTDSVTGGTANSEVVVDPVPAQGIAVDFGVNNNGSVGGLEGDIVTAISNTFFGGNAIQTGNLTDPGVQSDVISLVDAFGGSRNPGEIAQASVSGAAVFDDSNRLSAVAAEAELAPGQGIDPANNGFTVSSPNLTVTEGIAFFTGSPANRTEQFLEQGNLEFGTQNVAGGTSLNQAIATAVDGINGPNSEDAVSLVDAFVNEDDTTLEEAAAGVAEGPDAADVALD